MFKMTLKELDGILLEYGITDKENFGILTRNSREITELFFCLKEIVPDKWGIKHIEFMDIYNIYKTKTILFPYDGSVSACGELGAKDAKCMFWNDIKYYIVSKLRAEKIDSFKDPVTLTLTNVYINPLFKKYLVSRDIHEREELFKMMTEKDDRAQEQSLEEKVECETNIDYEDGEDWVNEPYNEDDYDYDPTEDSNYDEDCDDEYTESDEENDCAAYSASPNNERPNDSKEGEQITKDVEPAQEKTVETTETPAYMNILKDTMNSYQKIAECPQKFGREDLQTGDIIVRANGSIEVAIPQYDVLVRKSGYNRISELPKYFNSEDNVTNGGWAVTTVYRPTEAYHFCLNSLSHLLTKSQKLFDLKSDYKKDEWKIIAAGRYECPYCSKENKQKTAFCPHCGKSIMDIKE